MNPEFDTVKVSRERLISALLGDTPSSSMAQSDDGLTLVYRKGEQAAFPCAIVVRDEDMSDLFVWLETYAPQFTPISQYCRILTPYDAQIYLQSEERKVLDFKRVKRSAGLIVGEIIGQTVGDPIRTLDAATLVHAQSTYSFSIARSQLLWGKEFNAFELVGLFEDISRRGLTNQRRVSPTILQEVWDVALGFDYPDIPTKIHVVLDALDDLDRTDGMSNDTILALSRHFEPARELLNSVKNSAEERVLAFDRLLEAVGTKELDSSVALFTIAYAAIGVGGGTTRHMNLLAETGASNPLIWTWFGLIGSTGQDAKWHPMFAKLARLVARELSYSLDALDPPRADVDWREVRACGGSDPSRWLAQIPRSHSRNVAIELQPGVALTIPLNPARSESHSQTAPAEMKKPDISQLDEALAKLWEFRQQMMGLSKTAVKKASQTTKKSKSRRASPKTDRLL